MKKAILIAAATAGLSLLWANPLDKAQEKAQSLGTQIIGTWKLGSGTYGGQTGGSPEITALKHITRSHSLVVSYNKTNKVTQVIADHMSLMRSSTRKDLGTDLTARSMRFKVSSKRSSAKWRGTSSIKKV